MDDDLGWVTRVLDLVGGDRQQCLNWCRKALWALEKLLDGRGETEIPANRAK
jgi:hypothetical protein